MTNIQLIDKLKNSHTLQHNDFVTLISSYNDSDREYAAKLAREISQKEFGKNIFIRGIVEFSNYCKNDCLYCGIRRSNKNVIRYRLSKEEILKCCDEGYSFGYKTFVLQSGEDKSYSLEDLKDIVSSIKAKHPDCAVTLSIGELSHKEYLELFNAGADRYLLREETANKSHYNKLHPQELSFDNRINCLYDLKSIGYQTGCGFMVGSPFQTTENIVEDLEFIRKLEPHMVGIGPFIPHKDTPFKDYSAGSYELTLFLISILRLMFPKLLIPATTALGTINPRGRENGVLAGANVIMPNLSPTPVRDKYVLYDNKICTDEQSDKCRHCIEMRLKSIGYKITINRGDYGVTIND